MRPTVRDLDAEIAAVLGTVPLPSARDPDPFRGCGFVVRHEYVDEWMPALVHPNGVHWVFWCDDCLRIHWHGAAPGSRASHCMFDDSRYRGGYDLVYAGHYTDDVRRDWERRERSARSVRSKRWLAQQRRRS